MAGVRHPRQVATRAAAIPDPGSAPGPADPVGPFGPAVPVGRARLLRAAVVQLVRAEKRRCFPALLHVGKPGGAETVRPAREPGDDHALRIEVLAAMLRRVGSLPDPADPGTPPPGPADPLVWLTRAGPLQLQDVDAAWVAAVRAIGAELGLPLTVVVVTRTGWWDPVTGSGRRWRRVRPRS